MDTNIWLERLLDQVHSAEVGLFLSQVDPEELLMSDFTLHSIGVILARFGRCEVLPQFVDDVLLQGGVGLVSVPLRDIQRLVSVMNVFHLDFDDAYQYVAAEQFQAVIVSFDSDFERTERGRRTPAEVLADSHRS